MSMRYKGSRLSATANTPTSLTASGAWTLQQQMQANGTSTWPFVRDPQFNYVTMLLHGDGSAGANNGSGGGATPTVTAFNTDASTNNFNVTINGDARSNNFNPYQAGYYSNYFDGTGDYLSLASNSALQFGTGDFTFECWVYRSSASGQIFIADFGASSASGWGLYDEGSGGNMQFRIGDVDRIAVSPLNAGVWNHVAVVRSGTTATLYVNGASAGSYGSASTNLTYSGTNYIGSQSGSSSYINGYMSNVRAVKGTAVYTSNFTPSTTPLTTITNTSLLTCQSNRFIDNSTNAFTVTANGNTAVAPAQPFTLPSSVATYGSGYFDGTGDYLTAASTTAFDIASGTDFTFSCWVYFASNPNNGTVKYIFDQTSTSGSGSLIFLAQETNNAWTACSMSNAYSSSDFVAGQWYWITISRVSGTLRSFKNGTLITSGANTDASDTNRFTIAARYSNNFPISSAYLTDVRFVVGSGITTDTVPTSPLTAITNTQLLTTQYNGGGNNSGFKDSSQNNFAITRNGNTTQGTFAPYGSNWSNYFDGTGDYLNFTGTGFNFGTGAFTLEGWVYLTAYNYGSVIATWNSGTDVGFLLGFDNTGRPQFNIGNAGGASTDVQGATAIPLNTWTYIAATKTAGSGGTMTLYVNGVSVGTNTTTRSLDRTATVIGRYYQNIDGNYTFGYLSNVRVSNIARSISVPTSPLTSDTNTLLLTCQSNRFIDNSTNNFTITKNGDTSIQRFSPFANATAYNPATTGGSAYFDGSGDYLSVASGSVALSGDFTVEGWVYPTTASGNGYYMFNLGNDYFSTGATFFITTSGYLRIYTSNTNILSGTSGVVQLNTWNHIAFVRSGTTVKAYLNGTQVDSATFTSSLSGVAYINAELNGNPTATVYVGSAGYYSNVRIGTNAVYTANFTPPTAPLTTISNTSFLLSNTNSAILDQSMMNDLETVGNAQISTSVVKYGTASIAFDGTGDYLRPNSQLPFVFNTGDFTIEFWVYANSVSGWLTFLDNRPSTTGSGFFLGYNSGFQYYSGSSNLISGGTLSTSTWTHVALCRASGSVRIFVNGTQVGSTATDTSNYSTSTVLANGPFIGSNYVPSDFLNGYLDDFRVTKYARYTTTFTPPTQALPNG